jgi:hypothetical protein
MFRFHCLVWLSILSLIAVGCREASHPGNWNADRVSNYLSERLEASEMKLEPTGKGFQGTAKRADGETLTIDVSQFPARQEFNWTVNGDRGFVEEGFFGYGNDPDAKD